MPAASSSCCSVTTPSPSAGYSRAFKPRLTSLLSSLRLDISYESGAGNILSYTNEVGERIEVLDFVGGYGSLLLGHAHPKLTTEAVRLLTAQKPIHVQGSLRDSAHRLAEELSRRAGERYSVVFANSGAEAVEAALKHAVLQTGNRTFIALEKAFHGKTLAALQLTSNAQYREGLELPGLHVIRVAANDLGALQKAFVETRDLGGVFIEPIQGEGGVRPLTAAYAQRAAELCRQHKVPFIADECQTGLGRTGTFLACEQLGVRPDYIILSKALGGGIAKISALLVDERQYIDDFDLKHTSTYADDEFSCGIALKTLDLLTTSAMQKCAQLGNELMLRLRELGTRYSDVIREVRGSGLMSGVEFHTRRNSPSMIMRNLSAQKDLLFVLMGYLLHVHRIRVAPTLSDPLTLRLEPSMLLTSNEIGRLIEALEDVCTRLQHDDGVGLTSFLAGGSSHSGPSYVRADGRFFAYDEPRFQIKQRSAADKRVGWLCHLSDANDLLSLEPGYHTLSPAQRERLLEKGVARAWPIVMGSVTIRSRTGDKVQLYPICLPFTSRWLKQAIDARQCHSPALLVQKGVDLARSLGCQTVALGQYTSIITGNGTRVDPRKMGLTTGNSYALLLAFEALAHAEGQAGLSREDCTLVIVGAGGNIGSAAAEMLSPLYRDTVLIGRDRPLSVQRLRELAARLPRARASVDPATACRAHTVLVATNAVEAPLRPEHFKSEAIVCDISVPSAICASFRKSRPDVVLIRGGIAWLPEGEDLEIVGFPLPKGQTYGCMAEGLLLGFENSHDRRFTGPITSENLSFIGSLAAKHGFKLAGARTAGVLGEDVKEGSYAMA